VWGDPGAFLTRLSIGAPPDPLGPDGQDWGLAPPNPLAMEDDGGAGFGDLIAANMRHAGALRIDHVMGLSRLFVIPHGASGAEGTYLSYPRETLLARVALESRRAGCLVVGEDLGTVPAGIRERLGEAGVFGYRVLPFERDGQRFRPPSAYPAAAVACVATHDLPPLAGWWVGSDIAEREALGLVTTDEAATMRQARADDRTALLAALAEAGIEVPADAAARPDLSPALAAAIHGFLAASPSAIVLVQTDDLAGATVPVNLPGTDRERPNWRARLSPVVPSLLAGPGAQAILRATAEGRVPSASARPD
jgi:glycogen operon protein